MKKLTNYFKALAISLIAICGFLYFSNHTSNQSLKYSHAAEPTSVSTSAKNKLSSQSENLYSFLTEQIQAVAAGTKAETSFSVSKSTLDSWGAKTKWTATELGKSTITTDEVLPLFVSQFSVSQTLSALLHDHPYDMYWFDKTTGLREHFSASYTTTYVEIEQFTLKFDVCSEYQPSSYDSGNPTIDVSKTEIPKQALLNAKQIVNDYSSLNDHQKLIAYKNKICELVSYNDNAIDNPTPYGNPWQPVYVFDNNSSTNVVCEGYAKAFQLLCNLSTFQSSHVKCYTVSGNMIGGTGEGSHMWNIVTMDDQQTYLVDVTNCDSGTIGYPEKLFLTGTTIGSLGSGYTFALSSNTTFSYGATSLNLWGNNTESVLNLNTRNYEANYPTITVSSNADIIYDNEQITAGLVGTENVDLTFSFNSTDWLDNDYDWTVEWFDDNNNHVGTKRSSAPKDANFYWMKIIASNKTESSIKYIHSQRIEIKPKQISVSSVVGESRVYNGTTTVQITDAVLSGVFGTDKVSLDYSSLTANIKNSIVGSYSVVDLSNPILTGEHKNNYYISSSSDIPSNTISITPAKPTCTETFDKITESGKLLSSINITISATGVLNETIEGTFVWTNSDGEEIDSTTTKITKDTIYYYVFTPTNSNYESTIVEVKLWESEETGFKDLFSKENLPLILKISALIVVCIIIVSLIINLNKKSKQNKNF